MYIHLMYLIYNEHNIHLNIYTQSEQIIACFGFSENGCVWVWVFNLLMVMQ